jgi:hypothetical protein
VDVEEYIAHLRKVNTEEVILEVLRDQQHTILDLNIEQQMGGLNSAGEILGTYAEGPYKVFKESLNPAADGNVDLRLTGSFHNSFYIEAERFPVYIRARDSKEPKLVERYGEEIFGLTEENKGVARDQLKPYIVEAFRARVFLIR